MAYVIAEPCIDVKDRACIEDCPVDAIYEGPRGTYISPLECIDCGACAEACPAGAVFFVGDLPAKWKDWTAANAEFFEINGIEAAGGYEKVGPQERDHAIVEAYVAAEA
ncbi:ferredoxin [Nocardioides sp. zg-579]|uniref:Ferredoxin n=1 Tax=Nocardioides marmotae TaxID=2663857 RepID=A0A6I3J7D4_9ACTN|nr:ferredoxin [Nocardioides marmotae]MCR6030247.1 ferredoxin [Gordonia jinghuaiqii]MTB93879.1 ferredoxin [Nocardioides marmotae]QKE00202.1 4Fe-4S binding protein [Nocardioides marmotae]